MFLRQRCIVFIDEFRDCNQHQSKVFVVELNVFIFLERVVIFYCNRIVTLILHLTPMSFDLINCQPHGIVLIFCLRKVYHTIFVNYKKSGEALQIRYR